MKKFINANIIQNIFAIYFYNNLFYQFQNWLYIFENQTNPYYNDDLCILDKLFKELGEILINANFFY